MKLINRVVPPIAKTEWSWPDNDTQLLAVFDQVQDIELIMKHITATGVCIQAGGACGVWPYRYSDLFNTVYTFEPMQENRECLLKNLEGIDNIIISNKGLSDKEITGSMKFPPNHSNNYGSVYLEEGQGDVNTITIDSLDLKGCDLLQLDVEGHELRALRGGKNTITKFKPVVVLEEKPLPQLNKREVLLPRKFLEALGYKEVDRIHRDVVFKCVT